MNTVLWVLQVVLAALFAIAAALTGRSRSLQVVDTRYQAGRFGSGFKPRPKSDAGIRELPLAPLVVEAIRRQLPPEADGHALVFTGPGGGNGVPVGARTTRRATTFAASTSTQPTAPETTWRICDFADPTIFGTASDLAGGRGHPRPGDR